MTCQECIIEDETSVPICEPMFEHTHGGGGETTIEGVMVERGYWRATTKIIHVFPCFKDDACLGGLTDAPDYCDKGYEGPCKFSTAVYL